MLKEDLSLFVELEDFAVPCLFGPYSFNAIFDAPGENQGVGQVSAHTMEYTLRYVQAQAVLVAGMSGTVDGVAYKVREKPLPQHDGVFALALLTKV